MSLEHKEGISPDLSENTSGLPEVSDAKVVESIDDSTEKLVKNEISEMVKLEDSNSLSMPFNANEEVVQLTPTVEEETESKMLSSDINESSGEVEIVEENIEKKDPATKLLEEISIAEKELDLLKVAQTELHLQMEGFDSDIEEYLGALEDLDQWTAERKRSYAWKLLESLRGKRADLEADENILREFSESGTNLDKDFAPKTRKWILRRILWNLGLSVFSIAVILYVRRNKESILNGLSEKASNEVLNNMRIILRDLVAGANYVQLIAFTLLISFFVFLGTLFSYSRKVSTHSRAIDFESNKAQHMRNAIFEVKQSRIKIDALHPQVPQLLEVFAMALHDPLRVDNKYLEFSGQVPDTREIPESLEFASPTEESIDRVFETLVLKTLNELQVVGWREELLKKTMKELGESVGIGGDSHVLNEIYTDQRRNGKREVLLSLNQDISNRALLKIGDELIPKLAEIVQEKVLPTFPPNVKSLRPDPLDELELSDSIGENSDQQISTWEQKLIEAAGVGSPWSVINFSNEGQSQGKHLENIESLFIASKQICGHSSIGIQKYPEVDPGTRPFEVSIRVDLSSWCKPGDLAIFEGLEFKRDSDATDAFDSPQIPDEDSTVIY